MADKKSKETRSANWTIVLYPESEPDNWRDILDEMHIEWIESPLHDSDINANGEVKKAHRHILLMFSGVKAYEQVRELTDVLNCPSPQRCHNSKAMVRYMAHLDNPEKAQYNITDIKGHGGVDIAEMLRPSSSERYVMIRDMKLFVQENDIIEFEDLFDYAMENRFDDWFPLICDSAGWILERVIKCRRHRAPKKIDYGTGEVVE